MAANRNCVARAARGKWIVFVDDDELPEQDWLEHLFHAACSNRWDVIQGSVEPVNYPDSIFWYAPTVRFSGHFCTANLAIRREVLFRLGGFDEKMTVSHEDVELGRRIVKAGLPTTFLSDAKVRHPARRLTLHQVIAGIIQQQCQSYALQNPSNERRYGGWIRVVLWSARYWWRCSRIECAVSLANKQCRQFLIRGVIRALCCPLSVFQIIRARKRAAAE